MSLLHLPLSVRPSGASAVGARVLLYLGNCTQVVVHILLSLSRGFLKTFSKILIRVMAPVARYVLHGGFLVLALRQPFGKGPDGWGGQRFTVTIDKIPREVICHG